jgi:hypothetical protein
MDGRYNVYLSELSSVELSSSVIRAYRAFYMRPSYIWKRVKRLGSLDEFLRIARAGTEIFRFSFARRR